MARGGRNFFKEAGKTIGKTALKVADVASSVIPGGNAVKKVINKKASGGLNTMMLNNNNNANNNMSGNYPNVSPTINSYKKGGKTEAFHKKCSQRGFSQELADQYLEMADKHDGDVNANKIKVLLKRHGHTDPREHHAFGDIVGWFSKKYHEYKPKAEKLISKGKEYTGKAHDMYTKHKDTIHKGVDMVAGNKADKIKSFLNNADDKVKAARKKHGFKKGGHVKHSGEFFSTQDSAGATRTKW